MSFSFSPDSAWGAVAFAFIGAAIFGAVVRIFLDQRASRAWPHVDGRVTSTGVTGSASDGFTVEYECEYQVGGASYFLNGSLDGTSPTELIAAGRARDRMGQAVDVAYDPENPANATLDPGALGTASAGIFFAGGMLGYGVWMVWKWWAHAR